MPENPTENGYWTVVVLNPFASPDDLESYRKVILPFSPPQYIEAFEKVFVKTDTVRFICKVDVAQGEILPHTVTDYHDVADVYFERAPVYKPIEVKQVR